MGDAAQPKGLTQEFNETLDLKLRVRGAPYGTRTRVFAVKGRRPRPLDEGRWQ
jgi:hypothetical protein